MLKNTFKVIRVDESDLLNLREALNSLVELRVKAQGSLDTSYPEDKICFNVDAEKIHWAGRALEKINKKITELF